MLYVLTGVTRIQVDWYTHTPNIQVDWYTGICETTFHFVTVITFCL